MNVLLSVFVAVGLLTLVCHVWANSQQERFNINTPDGTTKYTVKESEPRSGRFDVFNPQSERKGYGIRRYDGHIDIYDTKSNRIFIIPAPSKGTSRPTPRRTP